MSTIIDSAPTSILIPRDGCVEVLIVAHNDDAVQTVLGQMNVQVGDQVVTIAATLPGSDASTPVFGSAILSAELVAAGVTVEDHGNGQYLVCGPDYAPATHSH